MSGNFPVGGFLVALAAAVAESLLDALGAGLRARGGGGLGALDGERGDLDLSGVRLGHFYYLSSAYQPRFFVLEPLAIQLQRDSGFFGFDEVATGQVPKPELES